MISGFALQTLPIIANEPVRDYAPGSPERASLEQTLSEMKAERIEAPLVIGGRDVLTGRLETAICPHDHGHVLADVHVGGAVEVTAAIDAARTASHDWGQTSWEERAGVFLRAADLLAGPWRARLNAATMLGQSKTAHQAEIDSAAELIDFWRLNARFMLQIYGDQPQSSPGVWNRAEYRPLDGFVYAASPFNFTAIAGNLPSAPALMGNTVVWKPSASAKYSAHFTMALLREAGLPDGVINLVYGDAEAVTEVVLASDDLAGVHFTGSTEVFDSLQRRVAGQPRRNYPRLVGETGGKNFILAHASADLEALETAIIRGGFEYQGQKCSAASRVFVPRSLWPRLKTRLADEIATIRVGDVSDLGNFMGAVIDRRAWNRHDQVLKAAAEDADVTVLSGGSADDRSGFFVQPTLLEVADPASRFVTEEFFGPIVSVVVYDDARYAETISMIDASGTYGLTGSIFARERKAVVEAMTGLRHAAGNFYINDKPTGAVVGQQPFGGARRSGTNDKAGSAWNLIRWTSPRTIKETFDPPRDWRYPFLAATGPV